MEQICELLWGNYSTNNMFLPSLNKSQKSLIYTIKKIEIISVYLLYQINKYYPQ